MKKKTLMECSLDHLQSFDLIISVKLQITFGRKSHWIKASQRVRTWFPFSFAYRCICNRKYWWYQRTNIKKKCFGKKKKLWKARLRNTIIDCDCSTLLGYHIITDNDILHILLHEFVLNHRINSHSQKIVD